MCYFKYFHKKMSPYIDAVSVSTLSDNLRVFLVVTEPGE